MVVCDEDFIVKEGTIYLLSRTWYRSRARVPRPQIALLVGTWTTLSNFVSPALPLPPLLLSADLPPLPRSPPRSGSHSPMELTSRPRTIFPLSVAEGNFEFPSMPLFINGFCVQGSVIAPRVIHNRMLDLQRCTVSNR